MRTTVRRGSVLLASIISLSLLAAGAFAQDVEPRAVPPAIDSGDTAWMLASSALVLVMIVPGLALFYSGLVRSKNAIGTMMHSFVILCVVGLIWILWGYSLAFAPDRGGIIGGLDWAALSGVGTTPNAVYGPTIPHQAFMMFQLLFAAFTAALVAGAVAERMRFSALLLLTVLWSTFIYAPVAHWMWGGGWLSKLGALDFAGGAVVHLNAGAAGLACALALGRRRGWRTDYMAPHNLPYALVGAGLLWFGWLGFSGGSARAANGVAVGAMVTTHLAGTAAALVWMTVEWIHRGKPTVLGIASGVLAGLASATPAAGYVGPLSAVFIGGTAGALSYLAIVWKGKIGYDDALEVVGTHAVGGIVGLLGTGLLASKTVNPDGADGLFFGNPALLGTQAGTILVVAVFSFVGTYVILKLVDGLIGLRITPEEEATGLDLSQHNERAYS